MKKLLIILVCAVFIFACASAPVKDSEEPVPTKSEVENTEETPEILKFLIEASIIDLLLNVP